MDLVNRAVLSEERQLLDKGCITQAMQVTGFNAEEKVAFGPQLASVL